MRFRMLRPAAATAGLAATLLACVTPAAAAGHRAAPPRGTVTAAGPRLVAGDQGRSRQGGAGPRCVTILAATGRTRASTPPRQRAGTGHATTYTVTVTGTTITGQPAGARSGQVFLFNADDSARFDNPVRSVLPFSHGTATFHVPAGHYWAVGDFIRQRPAHKTYDEYLDVLPQFTVRGKTTVRLTARLATSRVQAVLPRPAVPQDTLFQLIRSAAAGPPVSVSWIEAGNGPGSPEPALYVSPTAARPTAGRLATVTVEHLGTAAFPQDSRYVYGLAYQSTGTIPAQRRVVHQAALATAHQRYYSDIGSWGLATTLPTFPVENRVCPVGGALFWGLHFPRRQTMYLSAGPAVSWQTQYIQNVAQDYSGGQVTAPRAFVPGQRVTQSLGGYPLHPAPDVRLGDIAGLPPTQVSAGRTGNTLGLAMTAFSDSAPGDLGQGTFPPLKAAASYQIDQNGTKIAGGTVPKFYGTFAEAATLSPSPSVIRFRLDTSEGAKLGPLSRATRTVWTWRSAPGRGARPPAGWTCPPGGAAGRPCAVQPMMTLRYHVTGLRLDGSAAPGQQVVRVLAGHIQLARAARVTRAAVAVSFDGGKTWRAARITGRHGSYAAVFTAPAGARVTLRTSAADAAGGSVTETITNAYRTGA
ncbi:MAG TPA: hypothetical protein VGM53_35855 [Streptosporangiaceae bacterium]